MALKLYHSPISTCSQKVRVCLAEKGLAFESCVIDFGKQEHLSDEYLAINPNGVVPTLVHDGRTIIDSSVICEYVEDVWPENPLAPDGAADRATMRAWMRYLEEVPTTAIRVPSFNKLFAKSLAQIPGPEFSQMIEKMPLRKAFYRKLEGESGFNQDLYTDSIERLESTLVRVEKALSSSRWLLADQFSIADILLIPTIVRMDDIGLSGMWHDKKRVTRWYKEVQARPSFGIAFFPGARVDASGFELNFSSSPTSISTVN